MPGESPRVKCPTCGARPYAPCIRWDRTEVGSRSAVWRLIPIEPHPARVEAVEKEQLRAGA